MILSSPTPARLGASSFLSSASSAAVADTDQLRRLIARLACSFTTSQGRSVAETAAEGLRSIVELLDVDRAVIWRYRSSDGPAVAVSHWMRAPRPAPPEPLSPQSLRFAKERIGVSDVTCFATLDDLATERDREMWRRHGIRSGAVIPLAAERDGAEPASVLTFDSRHERDWPASVLEQLCIFGTVYSQALAREASQAARQQALGELRDLQRRLRDSPAERRPTRSSLEPAGLVADSPTARRAVDQIRQVAATTASVLLLGETGAGKELFARAIHELSPRRQRKMVSVNCAAIPGTLLESELFGREAGAYTGAVTRQIGRFEAADQSTLFLDEIGELPVEHQAKLLHVLQDHIVERLGGNQPIAVDVRVIAATNTNLERAVNERRFREDLFYRLNVFPIEVPPLRERVEDIPILTWQFIDEISASLGKRIEAVASESMQQLKRYDWPGNVRELRNVIERAVIRSTRSTLTIPVPSATPAARHAAPGTAELASFELEQIRAALTSAGWRIRGRGGAAERLGLRPTTLEGRMAKLGLTRPTA